MTQAIESHNRHYCLRVHLLELGHFTDHCTVGNALSAKGGFRRDLRPSENVFFSICMERRHTPKLWSQIMDGKFMVLTSVSLSLTDDDLTSHSYNPTGSTVWLLLLFLAREGVFFLLVFPVCGIGCERSVSS